MTFEILASDGSEQPGATPAWLIVDDSDCEIVQVPFHDGDTVDDAIERLIATGHLPEGAHLERTERMGYPYPWQLAGYEYRWTVAGVPPGAQGVQAAHSGDNRRRGHGTPR